MTTGLHANLALCTVRKGADCGLFISVPQGLAQCLVPASTAQTNSYLLSYYSVPSTVPNVVCILTNLVLSVGVIMILFYVLGNRSTERLRNLPKVMELIFGGVRIQIRLVLVCALPI